MLWVRTATVTFLSSIFNPPFTFSSQLSVANCTRGRGSVQTGAAGDRNQDVSVWV